MKTITLHNTNLSVPEIGMGCMRINSLETADAVKEWIDTALAHDINFFDHADIYAKGQSKEHILQSVDDILNRLRTDYLDILLLHRPDTLMEPEEVADAFHTLKAAGKVRHFGVSNQTPMQIELLNKYLDEPLLINQMQFSIAHCPMINSGINANMYNDSAINRDGGILEYCRLKDITIQAWSPFQYGMFEGVFLGNEKFPELKYNVTDSAIAVAWILRHPAGIQTIIGTTNKERIAQISKASNVHLTREEWYRLYMAAGNRLP